MKVEKSSTTDLGEKFELLNFKIYLSIAPNSQISQYISVVDLAHYNICIVSHSWIKLKEKCLLFSPDLFSSQTNCELT